MSDPNPLKYNFGDPHDDDAEVFEQYFETASAPAKPIPEPIPAQVQPTVKLPTRLITKNQRLDPLWLSPTLILPPDLNRVGLSLMTTSLEGGASILTWFSSEEADLQLNPANPSMVQASGMIPLNLVISLDGHTGAIYARTPTTVVNFSVWAVTT